MYKANAGFNERKIRVNKYTLRILCNKEYEWMLDDDISNNRVSKIPLKYKRNLLNLLLEILSAHYLTHVE